MKAAFPLVALFAVLIGSLLLGLGQRLGPAPAPDFAEFEAGDARKSVFYDYFVPIIEAENERILADRSALLAARERYEPSGRLPYMQRLWLDDLAGRYRRDDFDPASSDQWQALLRQVDIIPVSLALAQSANESAWGTSRFARLGNNYFGQWCFVEGCGLVPESRPEGANHEVAAFHSPRHSVERYMNNINTHNAYRELRQRRSALRNEGQVVTGLALAPSLLRYSERGQDYVTELQSMIRFNNLQAFDG